jgi:hypothetical protein
MISLGKAKNRSIKRAMHIERAKEGRRTGDNDPDSCVPEKEDNDDGDEHDERENAIQKVNAYITYHLWPS